MSSKGPPESGKVSRVRPIQRVTISRPTSSFGSASRTNAGSTMSSLPSSASCSAISSTLPQGELGASRQRQLAAEQATQIRDLEAQVAALRKQNVHLHREVQEALGLQQLKSRTVDALTKDLNASATNSSIHARPVHHWHCWCDKFVKQFRNHFCRTDVYDHDFLSMFCVSVPRAPPVHLQPLQMTCG
ncbi:hypothetical protein BIW11_04419 [Tropilaelaps mercedesae]|uniref:Uncharacterized protein n=1 Tax=Tropilaelaps mercedesae TaxID=418985 RepID=A0A1V9X6I1_9ACAR|nr:hypothetical protein BIW11_04419 [Tropilaelaps mercedesae]